MINWKQCESACIASYLDNLLLYIFWRLELNFVAVIESKTVKKTNFKVSKELEKGYRVMRDKSEDYVKVMAIMEETE